MKAVMVAFTNRTSGTSNEAFNAWYDEIHIPEVLGVPGFVAATRYRGSSVDPGLGSRAHEYLCVYEIEADDLATAKKGLAAAAPTWQPTDVLDLESRSILFYEQITETVGASPA
ncbi:MAG TPA: hypothetical protein VM938_15925 [Acidimicrobiales bacterium]|nr:hypothetical protein [Acidimicrobiales bacterium]